MFADVEQHLLDPFASDISAPLLFRCRFGSILCYLQPYFAQMIPDSELITIIAKIGSITDTEELISAEEYCAYRNC